MKCPTGRIHVVAWQSAVLFGCFLAGCSTKTEFDYSREAYNLQQANDKVSAETALKEGLRKYPNSSMLKYDLFNFYMKTNRWDDVEAYYQIAGVGIDGGDAILNAMAQHFFETKDWPKAHIYYFKSGMFNIFDDKAPVHCRGVEIERLRNAAAAAVNMEDSAKVEEAYRIMYRFGTKPECASDAATAEYLAEVKSWLPQSAESASAETTKPSSQ